MTVLTPSVATHPPRRIPLRIAVVQLRPKLGEINANIARARELCFKLKPYSIDLLCFPEMAFTGYVFDSAKAISPYLEEPRTGPTSLFCQEVAKHLACYVAGGYPERLSEEERYAESQVSTVTKDPESVLCEGTKIPLTNDDNASSEFDALPAATTPPIHTPVGANSAIIYGPSGEWVGGYRKTNLFETDKTWAKPGTGFVSFSLTLPRVTSTESEDVSAPVSLKTSIGICMDLNPFPSPDQTPRAEWPYELADFCVQNKSKVLVLLNAWLNSGLADGENDKDAGHCAPDSADDSSGKEDHEVEGAVDAEADEPDWHVLQYWAARLRPLWERDWQRRGSNETLRSNGLGGDYDKAEEAGEGEREASEEAVDDQEEERPPYETIVVVCNRAGTENGKTFAGSSAIFSLRAGSGRPRLLDMMDKNEEGVRVWNLLV